MISFGDTGLLAGRRLGLQVISSEHRIRTLKKTERFKYKRLQPRMSGRTLDDVEDFE